LRRRTYCFSYKAVTSVWAFEFPHSSSFSWPELPIHPMVSRNRTSQLQPTRKIDSYRRIVQLRKPRVKKRSKKSDAPSPYQLEKRLKKIVVTREVYTRSEHSPETPPRNFFDSVRLNRSATRRKVSAMKSHRHHLLLPGQAPFFKLLR